MKYKVVKDEDMDNPCKACCFFDYGYACNEKAKEAGLPNCWTKDVHFELEDEITTKDLTDIDTANDEKTIPHNL
jgi:hypothetical protein